MKLLALLLSLAAAVPALAQNATDHLLFGAAYYDEYMPVERLAKDVAMMKAAGINVVRIGESTWGTMETREGVFDFSHLDRVLAAMHGAGIGVIVGTPTYAIPTWLARQHPDILVTTPAGRAKYGPRQNMDITNPHFRRAAERAIRKMLAHVKDHPAIIGYQVDNETKPYNTSGPNVQQQFVAYCKQKYGTLDALNDAFGLNYWSNRINRWEDFPSTDGSINASLSAEFAKFQRRLVTDYLAWQARIVREYKRPGQFITQNFDLDWKGHSHGIQTEVDHFAAAAALDVAGVDIYHPTQDKLTGLEISFGGDLARSMKAGKNYLVMETQAQGFPDWTPYPGQLRLQAYSHLASGASMVSYWHWHSIHNSAETYWKGLLSHDFEPNPPYLEAKVIGAEFARIGPHLVNLRKENQTAILFSNEAQTALNHFPHGLKYNDILRPFYDGLYNMNVGVDLLDPGSGAFDGYKLIIVPALYAASDSLLEKLNAYARNGGHVLYTFRSGFSDDNVKVRHGRQPGLIAEAAGISYDQFTIPQGVPLAGHAFAVSGKDNEARNWMELLTPGSARVLARYDHAAWGKYAALTENDYGKGLVTYVGFMPSDAMIAGILADAVGKAGVARDSALSFPLISKSGVNQLGKRVHYYLNYSAAPAELSYANKDGVSLLSNAPAPQGALLKLEPWGVAIIEER
ncbi:beta-galactosidase [Pseudoduganella sp. LjRoot289]|uniref:beta-galactosidase n=1 Tax=Pseudoduganella sp. LjRoot289 TaxID=3342314 RepID=UPI003ECCFE3E